jgi:hypothetical protein
MLRFNAARWPATRGRDPKLTSADARPLLALLLVESSALWQYTSMPIADPSPTSEPDSYLHFLVRAITDIESAAKNLHEAVDDLVSGQTPTIAAKHREQLRLSMSAIDFALFRIKYPDRFISLPGPPRRSRRKGAKNEDDNNDRTATGDANRDQE